MHKKTSMDKESNEHEAVLQSESCIGNLVSQKALLKYRPL